MVADNQIAFGGVTMGAGTQYRIQAIKGLRGLPDVAANDTQKLVADGVFPGFDTLPGRTIDVDLTIVGPNVSAMQTALTALETAMAPLNSTTATLDFKLPSVAAGTFQVRPRKCTATVIPTFGNGFIAVSLEFFAPTP